MPAFELLKSRRFLPLFITQFGGALNDNLYKIGMIAMMTFGPLGQSGENAGVYAALAGVVFILPYFLLSALAGQLADAFDKVKIARTVKMFEVVIMLMAIHAFSAAEPSIIWMMMILLMLGIHSTFFGPVKYAVLPQYLQAKELMTGNALIEAGTFLAILIGTAMGVLLAPLWSAYIGLAIALLGLASAFAMPAAPSSQEKPVIGLNLVNETTALLRSVVNNRTLLLSIIGISWIWSLGAVIVGQMQDYTKLYLNGDQSAAILPLMAFTIGIGVGSMMISRVLKGEISPRYAPFAALGMSVFLLDFYFATNAFVMLPTSGWVGPFAVLRSDGSLRLLIDLFGIAFCAGAFIVPLYALLQDRAPADNRASIIAANNVLNAAAMVIFSGLAALLLGLGFSLLTVFLLFGALNLIFAVLVVGLLPDGVIKGVLKAALRFFYRVEIDGLEHYENTPGKAVVVVNHVSFLDGPLLMAFLPGKPTFAVNTFIAKQWWVRPFLNLMDAFPVDPTNPMAAKAMVRAVESGKKLVIFPEGRITTTGALMKIFEGPGMVAERADADIIPVRIDGAQFTPFSRLRGKVRLRWFPKIKITVLPPRKFFLPEGISARSKRQLAGVQLSDLMSSLIFETNNIDQTLFEALIDARVTHGANHKIVEDTDRQPMSYHRLLTASFALARKLNHATQKGDNVGVLLPNVTSVVVTFFGLQAIGRVPAMLNFSAGTATLKAALVAADIKLILTSRKFVTLGGLETVMPALGAQARVIYLEDLRASIKPWDMFMAFCQTKIAGLAHKRYQVKATDPAVVLFTSGSEGLPKGVVLSHRNLLANRHQLAARVDFNAADIVFNALPVFHSFGLTGGTLLPLFSGIKTILYPSPLHYRIVPAMVYDTNATIMFGTDTFLSGYARMAHGYDFYAIRYIFAGAERVKDETRRLFADKFGLRILEGYGATETAPVLAVNTPMHFKAGTVGRLLPGISHRLETVPGIAVGGILHVAGPNVMLGYLKSDQPGVLQPAGDGWYNSGDIVSIDEHGFISIAGRAKRFAKLGGEMVSLTAVEAMASKLWPDHAHAAVTRTDVRKGEAIILVTTKADATTDELLAFARSEGLAELAVPRELRIVDTMPVLATGKSDYVSLEKMVRG
jgi:acyl-[acyl-carrier-protein]-phospholipid O-acyltransferase / long-chain-fatty-acid--[acyl-carrier-protein] ligase